MKDTEWRQPVKVSLIQHGPHNDGPNAKQNTIEQLLAMVDDTLAREHPDFLMPTELATTPYFCSVRDTRYFEWAEPIPGPTTELFAERARKYGTTILLPMYESASVQGVRYNSVVVLGPEGEIIEGRLPDGRKVKRYAKVHIPALALPDGRQLDERFYFNGGDDFPVFDTPKGTIGIYICYDRHFPEGWRTLALRGAQVVFNPACAVWFEPEKGARSESMYQFELQTMAMQNIVWVCAANRVGTENVQGALTRFYGKSAIYHPTGEIVAAASSEKPQVITHTVDLAEAARMRDFWSFFRFRRPNLYAPLTDPMI